MSCPSWQWHRTGSRWFPVRTLPVAPLWCDLGFVLNSRGNKAAANLRPEVKAHTLSSAERGLGGNAARACPSLPDVGLSGLVRVRVCDGSRRVAGGG